MNKNENDVGMIFFYFSNENIQNYFFLKLKAGTFSWCSLNVAHTFEFFDFRIGMREDKQCRDEYELR